VSYSCRFGGIEALKHPKKQWFLSLSCRLFQKWNNKAIFREKGVDCPTGGTSLVIEVLDKPVSGVECCSAAMPNIL
jgi:hypothetical protein